MKSNSMIKRSCVLVALIVSVIAFSGTDAFGQFGRMRRDDNRGPNVRLAARDSLKAEVILESNASARTEWKLGPTQGGPPIRRVLETANMPGAPTVVAWEFGEMSRSSANRVAKFRFKFFDSENHEYDAEFSFYPREGRVRFEYNASVGFSWDFDKESSANLTPTKRTLSSSPRGMVGAPTTDEWTLGKVLDAKEEGTAVFRLNFRGDDCTEIKVKVRK